MLLLWSILTASSLFAQTTPFELELIAKEGDPAAGTTGTLNLGRLTEDSLAISCGNAFFFGESTEPSDFSLTRIGIWQGSETGLRDLVIDGQVLPAFSPQQAECVGVGPTCGQIFNTSNLFYVSPPGDVLLLASREDNLGTRAYFDGTTNANVAPILSSTDTVLPFRSLLGLKTGAGNYLVDQFIGTQPFGEPGGGLTNFVTPLIGEPPPSISEALTVSDVFGTVFSDSGVSFGFNQNADRLYVARLSDGGEAIYFQSASASTPLLLERTGGEVIGIAHGAYISFLTFTSGGTTGTAQINDSRSGFYVVQWRDPDAPISNSNPLRTAIIRFEITAENVFSRELVASEYVHPLADNIPSIVVPTTEFGQTVFEDIKLVRIAPNGEIWFFAKGLQLREGGIPDRSDERVGLWRKQAGGSILELVWRYSTSDSPGSPLPEGPNVPGTPLPDGTFFRGTGSQGYGFDEHSHIVFAGPEGLYAEDSSGMRLVVAKGQEIEVAPGDVRTVSRFVFNSEAHVGGVMQSYRRDQLVFMVVFTDGSEAIFRTAADLPDPTVPRGALIVNSIRDAVDRNPGDGVCDTGFTINCLPECTLRAAIQESNAGAGKQSIHFDIPADRAVDGIFEIQIHSNLPVVTDPVIIDATTQPGYQPQAPVVELNARPIPFNVPSWGFDIAAGDSTVRGFWINRVSKNGVFLHDGCCNIIQSNVIGANHRGEEDRGTGEHGIWIKDSGENLIGGASEAERNVISGNGRAGTGGFGLSIEGESATANRIQGNYIGTDVTGAQPLGNTNGGIQILEAPTNSIGGSEPHSGNVISANSSDGIQIEGNGSRGNLILGNLIGLSATGRQALPNRRNGVRITRSSGAGNVIGGLAETPGAGPGNVISANLQNGIQAESPGQRILGNIVGTNRQSAAGLGNQRNGIRLESEGNQIGTEDVRSRNVISGNQLSGILIETDGTITVERNQIDAGFIGTDLTGAVALPNQSGIVIRNSPLNRIGAKRGNLISGNRAEGIFVTGNPSNSTRIENNHIGTDGSALAAPGAVPGPLGNSGTGVLLRGVLNTLVKGNVISANGEWGVVVNGKDEQGVLPTFQASANNQLVGNVIGGDIAALGNRLDGVLVIDSSQNAIGPNNRIQFNRQNGINLIRLDLGEGNLITQNRAADNGALGIDLEFDGVTANDPADGDGGANGLQNFPQIDRVFGWPLYLIQGSLSSKANHPYTVELFFNLAADDPSGHGEGEFFIKALQLTTEAGGLGGFSSGFFAFQSGCISATATDDGTQDTSEFSECVPIPPPVEAGVDFGDAPDIYPTLLADDGARHLIGGRLFLGGAVDGEPDGQADPSAAGDDGDGSDDEEGVSFPEPIFEGASLTRVEVTASDVGMLDAWFDFNRDGDWDDPSEQVWASRALAPGLNVLTFATPLDALTGATFARFRISAGGGLTPYGPVLEGEVEDYAVEILPSAGPRHRLNVQVSPPAGGTVTAPGIACPGDCSESYLENASVTVGALPAAGFQFLGWSGDLAGMATPQQVGMNADREVTAYFGSTAPGGFDGDGIPDGEEMGPQGTDPSFDGNNDGVPDYQQDSVASLPTLSGGGYATLEVPPGQSLSSVSVVPNPSPGDAPAGAEFPYGFFSFDVTGLAASACTTVTLHLPRNTAVTRFFKYGPTPDNLTPHWYDFAFDGKTGAEISHSSEETRVALHLCDGLRGDGDLTADGKLTDPGGPAIMGRGATPVEDIPTLSFYGQLLLALGLMLFVLLRGIKPEAPGRF